MNCMLPEAEVSRGKTHQKVSGQITSQLKGLVGPGLWHRRKKRKRQKGNGQGVSGQVLKPQIYAWRISVAKGKLSLSFSFVHGDITISSHRLGSESEDGAKGAKGVSIKTPLLFLFPLSQNLGEIHPGF